MLAISRMKFVGFETHEVKTKDGKVFSIVELAFSSEKSLQNILFRESYPFRGDLASLNVGTLKVGADYLVQYDLSNDKFMYKLRLKSLSLAK
jgi:hypothetical protein